MAQALALVPQRVLGARLEPVRVLDERTELGQPRLGRAASRAPRRGAARAAWSSRHATRARRAASLLVAEVGVEHLELIGGPCEPALLELPRHRDQSLADARDILPGRRRPTRGPRTAVGEDPSREDDAVLVVGPELRERLEPVLVEQAFGQVELRLDVGLFGAGAEVGRIPFRAERHT